MLEEDPEFFEEFKRIFYKSGIPEVDDYTPEVIEYTYVYIEIAQAMDGEGTEFAEAKNACGIQIISQ